MRSNRAKTARGGTDVVGLHERIPPGVTISDNETGWRMALGKLAALAESTFESDGVSALSS